MKIRAGGNCRRERKCFNERADFTGQKLSSRNTLEIAKLLTDSQKQRLSNVFLLSVNEHLAKLNDADGEEEITPDYESISLTKHWDKTYLAITSFTYLQNTDSSNGRKVSYLMSVVALFLDDEKLYEISGNYASALSEDENTLTEVPKEVPVPEIMSESENWLKLKLPRKFKKSKKFPNQLGKKCRSKRKRKIQMNHLKKRLKK